MDPKRNTNGASRSKPHEKPKKWCLAGVRGVPHRLPEKKCSSHVEVRFQPLPILKASLKALSVVEDAATNLPSDMPRLHRAMCCRTAAQVVAATLRQEHFHNPCKSGVNVLLVRSLIHPGGMLSRLPGHFARRMMLDIVPVNPSSSRYIANISPSKPATTRRSTIHLLSSNDCSQICHGCDPSRCLGGTLAALGMVEADFFLTRQAGCVVYPLFVPTGRERGVDQKVDFAGVSLGSPVPFCVPLLK